MAKKIKEKYVLGILIAFALIFIVFISIRITEQVNVSSKDKDLINQPSFSSEQVEGTVPIDYSDLDSVEPSSFLKSTELKPVIPINLLGTWDAVSEQVGFDCNIY